MDDESGARVAPAPGDGARRRWPVSGMLSSVFGILEPGGGPGRHRDRRQRRLRHRERRWRWRRRRRHQQRRQYR